MNNPTDGIQNAKIIYFYYRPPASFVFVTPHRWDGKDDWAAEKQKEGIWKNVKVIDNVEMADWIEMAPVASCWFARKIGIPIDSFRDIDLFLNEFQTQYGSVKIAGDLIIGGRDEALSGLSDWISSDSKEIVIQGESVEESTAFIAATIKKLPNDKEQQISAQTLFVDEQSAIDMLGACHFQHYVVPLNNEVYKRVSSSVAKCTSDSSP